MQLITVGTVAFDRIETPFGPVRLKITEWKGVERPSPEYEDCKALAEKAGVPVSAVLQACASRANTESVGKETFWCSLDPEPRKPSA